MSVIVSEILRSDGCHQLVASLLSGLMPGNDLANDGQEFSRNLDNSTVITAEYKFILGNSFFFRLLCVEGNDFAYLLFAPPFWESALLHDPFFFLRLLYAARGLPIKS